MRLLKTKDHKTIQNQTKFHLGKHPKPSSDHHSKINQNQIQIANTQNPLTHSEINQNHPQSASGDPTNNFKNTPSPLTHSNLLLLFINQPKTNQKSSKITKSHRQPLHQEIRAIGPSTVRSTPSAPPPRDSSTVRSTPSAPPPPDPRCRLFLLLFFVVL